MRLRRGDTSRSHHGDPIALTEWERYCLDLNGYVVLDNVLSFDDARELYAIVGANSAPPAETIQSQRFDGLDFLLWDDRIQDLLDQPRVLGAMRELCGPWLRLDHAYGIIMAPGTSGLGLHGGGTPYDPSQYYEFRDGAMRNGLCAAIYALVDHPAGAGGFCCVPGSHKANFRLPPEIGDPECYAEVVAEVPLTAGSCVVFTEALTHGTTPWSAGYDRRCLVFKYMPGHGSWGRAREIPTSLDERLTDRQRRLLEPPYVAHRSSI